MTSQVFGDDHGLDENLTTKFTSVGHSPADMAFQLRGIDEEDKAAIEALPATSALLIARRGPNAGARFLLDTDAVKAGRHPKSDIFLDDVTVSRKHALFLRSGHTFTIKDSASLNGTYVNGELIDERILANGDEVRIGKYQFTFFSSPQAVV